MIWLKQTSLPKRSSPPALQLGLLVFIILAILTVAEFVFALFLNVWPLLALMAVLKAGLVMYYYMHFTSLLEVGEGPGP